MIRHHMSSAVSEMFGILILSLLCLGCGYIWGNDAKWICLTLLASLSAAVLTRSFWVQLIFPVEHIAKLSVRVAQIISSAPVKARPYIHFINAKTWRGAVAMFDLVGDHIYMCPDIIYRNKTSVVRYYVLHETAHCEFGHGIKKMVWKLCALWTISMLSGHGMWVYAVWSLCGIAVLDVLITLYLEYRADMFARRYA